MCSERNGAEKCDPLEFENDWDIALQQLKYDIDLTEKQILLSEHARLMDNRNFTDDESPIYASPMLTGRYFPNSLDAMVPGRPVQARKSTKTVDSPRAHLPTEKVSLQPDNSAKWVSPIDANKGRRFKEDHHGLLVANLPNSCLDAELNSSVISLDFGLVSPRRNWSSPPQRIERAENREWSPHRIIDRPNPENSPGNWVSVKESCQQSLAPGLREPIVSCPPQGPRSTSQNTYVVPETPRSPVEIRPTRKISVLLDYDGGGQKKQTATHTEQVQSGHGTQQEKNRKVMESVGRVRKVSLLDDFKVPNFVKSIEKNSDDAEKENFQVDTAAKAIKRTSLGAKKIPGTKLSTLKAKKGETSEKTNTLTVAQQEPTDENVPKKENGGEEKEDLTKNTEKLILDLENILREKPVDSLKKEKDGSAKPSKRPLPVSEKPLNIAKPEKKKRNIDTKIVQEFMKNQKLKRQEEIKTSKKSKIEEREAIKKKLEELRLKTLKLAAQSKKKKVPESAIKIVEQPTEEDITMSLGLKQVKPKVSYNESISNLRKKPSQVKVKATNPEIRVGGDAEEAEEEQEINVKVDVEEESVKIISEAPQLVKPPTDSVALDMKAHSDLNATLKKLAETLHFKIEEKERQLKSRPTSVTSKSVKDPLSRVISEESIRTRSDTHDHRKMITIDLETIHALKEDIKRISENFKVLHEIIVEKADLNDNKAGKKTETNEPVEERQQEKEQERSQNDPCQQQSEEVPLWVQSGFPRPHPYNVYTAFRQKMNLQTSHSLTSVTSRETSPYAGTLSNKYDSEFETLSLPSDRLRSSKQMFQKSSSKKLVTSNVAATNENPNSYNDSGSELSSSIFDYEKQILTSVKTKSTTSIVTCRSNSQESTTSTAISEVISNNHHVGSPDKSLSSRLVPEVDLRQERENLILVTPDVKLITNQVADKKLNGFEKNLNTNQGESSPKMSFSLRSNDELNNSEDKSVRESKTESTITEIIDNLSEIDKSSRTVKPNKKVQNIVQKVEEPQNVTRRTFFQPEMLHLQFQAELSLLETFQQSLSHFLEAERKKTLSEVTKIVYEKSVNTEKALEREDQGVQTTFIKEDFPQNSPNGKTETDMIVTEVEDEKSNDDAEDLKSVMTEKSISSKIELDHETEDKMGEISEKISLSTNSAEESEKESEHRGSARRAPETPDFSTGHNVISFQMLNRMIKDEELRSEHQLALIRLREKTLNEKVKAELTFLEMRKRALKEGGGSDGEQNVSAIKKKQRGILLKYQSEKEEIERLKKMHKIASEERNIMMKQQKQIQQMQLSTKDMLIKLRKREKSPLKKSPVKSKVFKSFSTQSEIQDVALDLSDSILTESAYSIEESIRQSNDSDMEISSDYNECNTGNDKISRGNRKRKENRVTGDFESPVKMKQSLVKAEKHPEGRHSVEELVTWTKLLEEKENRLKELEKQTIKTANKAKSRLLKTSKNLKSCMKDRSTSPFHFPDNFNAPTEKSSSINEMIVTKTSSTLSEDIPESILKMETSEMDKYVVDKVQNSISEDIPVQFSKAEVNGSESRTMEYYTESFESPSLSEAHKVKIINAHSKSMGSEVGCRSIPIKLSLSPRIQSPRRRNSSGSDDSINLSHTETASEQSDLESRIAALHEQLRKRKLEAERLRREQKKAQRERLKVKEQSLLKQIQAYDAYIEKKKMELEQEYDHSVHAISKPLIKQPKVAEKSSVKKQEPLLMNYARVSVKAKTKEDSSPTESGRATESVNEIIEQIKVSSESIKEDIRTSGSIQEELSSSKDPIQSQIEDLCEAEVKDVTSTVEVDTSLIEASEIAKESSESPGSKPKTELVPDASLSESDDQSASIKTTLHSPEKQDTDAGETKEMTEVIEEGSIEKEHAGDSTYLSDSFESDADEKSLANESKTQQVCDVSPTETNIVSDLTDQQSVTPEKQEETVTPEEYVQVKTDASVEDDVKEGDTSSVSEVLEQQIQVEEDESKKAKAESISDYIILDLLKESLKTYAVKKDEVERKLSESTKMSQANLADDLSRGIITEGIEDMLKVYGRKTKRKEEEVVEESISPERITTDIRKRICEIMSHSSGVKDQRRPQDMMVTTYDVTPRSSPPPPEEEITSFNEKEEFLRSLISPSNKDKTEVLSYSDVCQTREKTDTFGQEWFDDDFGLSRTRREAEELRLQQLQIEQEIQQLQAQQEHIPYFYLREIPNKPPPPYTPPGKPLSEIPNTEADLVNVTTTAVRILTDEMARGKSLEEIEPTNEFYEKVTTDHMRCYKKFLFDLTRHILEDVFSRQKTKTGVLPWTKTRTRLSVYKYCQIERTFEALSEHVKNRVSVLFGFTKKVGRESLTMRCFKKKRDHVDEILVAESQEEESEWTEFDEDQVSVKNEVALAILDGLLLESAQLVKVIANKRMKKE